MNKIDVSLLICCHYGVSYNDFKKTFISILNQQDTPNEIIIIKNGHLNKKLDDYLNEIKFSYQINLIQLKKNTGLAKALNIGIQYSKNNLIARIDPGDVVINNRFYIQKAYMKQNSDISICGSYANEIYKKRTTLLKKPTSNSKIINGIRFKNPIIHSTVMFKKIDIQKIGSYPIIDRCQDYFLWVKCLEKGYCFDNIPKALIEIQLDKQMMERRDLNYYKHELFIYKYMLSKKIINFNNFLILSIYRLILRIIPTSLKILVYRLR